MKEVRKPDKLLTKILPPVKVKNDVTYVPSRFVLPFEHDGRQYAFNTLTKQCVEAALPAEAKAGEGFDELIEGLFLVPSDKDECAYYNSISSLVRAYGKNRGSRTFTILPTLGCNARCVYCYEEGRPQVTMTPEIVERTIRFIIENHKGGKAKLAWFGGEPLLCQGTIDRICEGMREAGLEYKSSLITNGSLITPEVIGKMTGDWKLERIQISMDGMEKDYICRKNYKAYHGYYIDIMEKISLLSEAGIAVSIRCNVDFGNWDGIPRFLDDLKENVANKEKVSVYFAPLNDVRMVDDDLPMWEKIRDARHLIEEAGFRPAPFMKLGMSFRTNHCMADGGSVVIGPDGSLYPCEHCPDGSRYGDIFNGTTDAEGLKEFCRIDRTREKCRKCPFLPDCTSFAACPIHDTHCREVRQMMAMDVLKRMVQDQESSKAEEEDEAC